jgi:hypothetical protein
MPLDDASPTYTYLLTDHLSYSPSHAITLALIKRSPTLDPMTPLAAQLHFLNLFGGDETPYESLHAVVSCGVKPWFDAFVGTRAGAKDHDSKMGSSSVAFESRHFLLADVFSGRYTHDQEEICRTRAVFAASAAKRRNTRDAFHYTPCHPTCRRTSTFHMSFFYLC